MPVHVYGNLCNHEKIEKIAKKYNLKVIYDAAHAFGEMKDGVGAVSYTHLVVQIRFVMLLAARRKCYLLSLIHI